MNGTGSEFIPWPREIVFNIITRTPLGLVDSAGRVIGVFVGPPTGDPTWPAVMKGVEAALAEAKRTLRFSKKQDRRGTFKTIAAGLSYGGGQTVREL